MGFLLGCVATLGVFQFCSSLAYYPPCASVSCTLCANGQQPIVAKDERGCDVECICPQNPCRQNEGFYGCDLSCSRLAGSAGHLQCAPGYTNTCVCKPGFYRTKEGACVRKLECPEFRCPSNSTWSYCGTECARGERCDGSPCTYRFPHGCYPGCKCDQGYKIHPDGRCIKAEDCPPTPPTPPPPSCPANETFIRCQSCQEHTCEDFPRACAFGCLKSDTCTCKTDYVRNGDGLCVRKGDCPKIKCGPNEVYKTCGNRCHEPKCELTPHLSVCLTVCERGCFCRQGYARDASNTCVYAGTPQCPKRRSA